MKLDNLKELVKEELKRALNEEISSIETLEDAITFLNNNKQNILQIADKHAGDVQAMQQAIDVFLQPYTENTPQPIVDRIKASIGGAISKRNIKNSPELSKAQDALKNVKGFVG
jgi:uncharacterized protein (UPF0335 family)